MATAIEYGLIAALVAVAGIAAVQGIAGDTQPIVRGQACTTESVSETGKVQLSCPGVKGVNLSVQDTKFALSLALRPRPLVCDLYQTRDARCFTRRE